MNTKKILLQSYLVISGGIFGWAFGAGLFLLLTAIIGNLLALTATGQQILKALQPIASFFSVAVPVACIIAGIIVNLKRMKKHQSTPDKLRS
jgi:hypothetical protein